MIKVVKVKMDLTGKIYGNLKVIRQAEDHIRPNGTRVAMWECECMCDKHTKLIADGYELRRGHKTSCGCLKKEKIIDLTNNKFGRLTVINRANDYVSKSGRHVSMWECKCECGNTKIISGKSLKSGDAQSCGCLSYDSHKKYNRYDLSGKFGKGYTADGKEFWFDIEDYDKIKNYYWSFHIYNNEGYVYCASDKIAFHRLVMNCQNEKWTNVQVDHKDHNTLDNRKNNLRIVTASQNGMNRGIYNNNTSGTTGVSFHKSTKKWAAYITKNRKTIYLGEFSLYEDAVKARNNAEEEYFKQYSYKNSIKGAKI